ncbi:MAG: diaminopimelate epimerase [Bryobacteraceae bacterium]
MTIPFIKAHGAGNDFLYTFAHELPAGLDMAEIARRMCHRNTGIGADGWYVIDTGGELPWVRLWNSDGSSAGLSGNGTRCAAAILAARGLAGDPVRIVTGSGERVLHRRESSMPGMWFEMEMGSPRVEAVRYPLELAGGAREVTIVDVGNPQCAAAVEEFPADWAAMGAEIEGHGHFPERTNVSFIRRVDRHTIEARFYERGAGHTLSSGTGSTGAAVAAILLDLVESPVTVRTEFGPLYIRWEVPPMEPSGPAFLTGPAEEIGSGQYSHT